MSSFRGFLKAQISVTPVIGGVLKFRTIVDGVPGNSPLVEGNAEINELKILDVFDLFRTEDGRSFLVTESGDHLGFY